MLRSSILMHTVLFVILAMTPLSISQTVNPADQFLETGQLSDPNLEARAVALGRTLRCVVCANQSIEDSEVEMAQTLRRFVRERLGSGDLRTISVQNSFAVTVNSSVMSRPNPDLVGCFGPLPG